MSTNTAVLGKSGFEGFLTRNVRSVHQRLQANWAWRKTYNITYQELTQLTDRDLADLGMMRGDLSRIAKDAADDVVRMS